MDLQATAQLLGNFGEFFGAIAVAVTLIYLSLQVRQSHRSTKADVNQRLNDELASLNRDVYLNPEFAALVNKAYKLKSLNELNGVEVQQLTRYFATVLNRGRQIYELNQDRIVSKQTVYTGVTYLDMFLTRPIFVSALEAGLRNWYPTEYVEYVDRLIEAQHSRS